MTFQVAEPLLGLASLQHGYFAPPGDHRIELTVANGFDAQLELIEPVRAGEQLFVDYGPSYAYDEHMTFCAVDRH